MENALSHIIEKDGIGVLTDSHFFNCLDDLKALDYPGVKRVIMTMIDDDFCDTTNCIN